MNSSCDFVWTPLVDEKIEGHFISSVTGQLATSLPWGADQPGGGMDENNVAINVADKSFNDFPKSERHCTACQISKITEFYLIGVCSDTFFGKELFLMFISNPFLLLKDLKYVLTNTRHGVQFRGIQSQIW